ncbi:hypothetical protein Nepgr_020715 [Nepenthes gracilis]|uniref:Uncharacterized protein n=1 Tax=Nepenthes gracilis TaxID=150966 RepID=A0AAD3SY43_NEPGR|nr:hypothetical protein Nepgr_020715 [Nepenthes gracilis]
MNHPREAFTPQISRKRKEREQSCQGNSNDDKQPPASNTTSSKPVEPNSSNRLLAGYMAYEFLSHGTMLGQKFDEDAPLPMAEPRKKPSQNSNSSNSGSISEPGGSYGETSVKKSSAAKQRYAEVAYLLKTDGAHIPRIVNPTQLDKWIQTRQVEGERN